MSPSPAPASIWRDRDFVRLWLAATVSIFGSLVTRTALPFTAILVLGAGPLEIAVLRSLELVAALMVGLFAGAWVDRLRRRPIMIAADLGRAVLLGSIPVAAVLGVLSIGQLYAVAFLAAALTTFFDVADRSFLPTLIERDRLLPANSALTASASAAEFSAFGVGGILIQLFSAPLAIALDALSFVASALLIGSIRRPEPPPPPVADREPVLREIRDGWRLVARSPVLRALAGANASTHVVWGVFGATYLVYASQDLGLGPATIGLVAAVGGASALVGALLAGRIDRRFGLGPTLLIGLVGFTVGSAFVPLAPAGAVGFAVAFLVIQQLLSDSAATVYDVTELSLRQSIVDRRALGRVNATIRFTTVLAQLGATVAGGVLAETLGLRSAMAFGVLGGLGAIACIWFSPIRAMRTTPPPIADQLLPGDEIPLTE